MLGMQGALIFRAPFNRRNLFYEVQNKPASHEAAINQLADLIKHRFENQSGKPTVLSKHKKVRKNDGIGILTVRLGWCKGRQMSKKEREILRKFRVNFRWHGDTVLVTSISNCL